MSLTGTALSYAPSEAVRRIVGASRRVQQPQSSSGLVSLAMGEPNFDTPAVIREAAEKSLAAGRTHYSPLYGEQSLRDEIAQQLSDRLSEEVKASDVLITQGGTGGLGAALLSLVSPGDKVVIPDPTYSLYADLVAMAGGELVTVPLGEDLHWDMEALAAALQGARLFVFCNPSNPTGIVHSRSELLALAQLVEGTETIIVSDEAYSELNYTNEPFTSALEIPELRSRTVYCQTFSKTYAMTGWRVGYLWGPTELIRSAARVHNTFNGSVNTVVQDAALAALRHAAPEVAVMRQSYLRRRTLLTEALSGVPGLTLSNPEGAFYLFPRYDFEMPSVDVVAALREAGVAVRPGSEFGAAGEYHLRISYAASDEALREGAARLAAGMTALRSS